MAVWDRWVCPSWACGEGPSAVEQPDGSLYCIMCHKFWRRLNDCWLGAWFPERVPKTPKK